MEVVVTTGAISRAKLQSNHHHQHPVFYRPDALPVAQPTVSKHWREKVSNSMDLLTPSSPGLLKNYLDLGSLKYMAVCHSCSRGHPFSALTVLVRWQKGHPAGKKISRTNNPQRFLIWGPILRRPGLTWRDLSRNMPVKWKSKVTFCSIEKKFRTKTIRFTRLSFGQLMGIHNYTC